MVAAAYRHRMSRALDPQLHTHVVCANVARGPDGRWTALEGRRLLRARQDRRVPVPGAPARRGARAAGLGVGAGGQGRGRARRRRRRGAGGVLAAAAGDRARPPRRAGARTSSERGKCLAVATRERKQYGVETHTWREEISARARASTGSTAPRSSELLDARPRARRAAASAAPCRRRARRSATARRRAG